MKRLAWTLGVGLATVVCQRSYLITATKAGPQLRLDMQTPARQVTVHGCVEGTDEAEYVNYELRLDARTEGSVDTEVRLAISRPPSDYEWEVTYRDTSVTEAGAQLTFGGGNAIDDACEVGQTFWIERVDANLEGTLIVDWRVEAEAYGGPGVEEDGSLHIEID